MKQLGIFLILFFSTLLVAAPSQVKYDITFSLFGKIAQSVIEYDVGKDHYFIAVQSETVGTAASLSNDRREYYASRGIVDKNGMLIPLEYITTRKTNNREKIKHHYFDHENRTVSVVIDETKRLEENYFDFRQMRIVSRAKEVKEHKTETNDYYASDDLISLFFNANRIVDTLAPGEKKMLHAIGVNTEKGEVVLKRPDLDEAAHMTELMPSRVDRSLFSVNVTEDIFADEEGALLISLDGDALPGEAMLEGVIMFGDVRAQRVYDTVAMQNAE